jgi:hypothetical protein
MRPPVARAGAGAQIAAAGPFRGRRCQQPLLGAQAPQHSAMPGAAAGVAHQDRHHDLVHREYHAGGGAGAAEHVTDIDGVGHAGAFAAELDGNQQAQQPFGTRGRERFAGKPRLTVDRIGMSGGRRSSGLGAQLDVAGGRKDRRRNMRRHGVRRCSCHHAVPLAVRGLINVERLVVDWPTDWRSVAETASIPPDMLRTMVIRINIYIEAQQYIRIGAMVCADVGRVKINTRTRRSLKS